MMKVIGVNFFETQCTDIHRVPEKKKPL